MLLIWHISDMLVIHYGEEAQRAIRGQVSPEEAEELQEEGIPALPLPPGLVLGDEVH